MTICFEKLAGNVTELEMKLSKISKEIEKSFGNYAEICQQILDNSNNLLNLLYHSDQKNVLANKEQFKNLTNILKKEVEQPLKFVMQELTRSERDIKKLEEKVKIFNEKNPNNHKSNHGIHHNQINNSIKSTDPIEQENLEINLKKLAADHLACMQKLDPPLAKILKIQEVFDKIKATLEFSDERQEQAKLINHLKRFIAKLQLAEQIEITNYQDLLVELKGLENFIYNLALANTELLTTQSNFINKPLLTQFGLGTIVDDDMVDSIAAIIDKPEIAEATGNPADELPTAADPENLHTRPILNAENSADLNAKPILVL